MKDIDYSLISDNEEVVELLKERVKIDSKITKLDTQALILLELHFLGLIN